MSFFEFLFGVTACVAGGYIGARRWLLLLVFGLSAFSAVACFGAFHKLIAYAIVTTGVEAVNASVISGVLTILCPLTFGLYWGLKLVTFLGIGETTDPYAYSESSSNIVDRLFGSGIGLLAFLFLWTYLGGTHE